ncbi:hypothetical protein LTR62_007187 [Meristemomyces frigidus]|uniref:Oxidoreductase FAD/NAD(P)-binding domain-containing protein n=1 Tax=Meristemomyces frigidus TaxID=1508187 RepID=A0AAN7TB70_9PEZI|nr:hypothetical protein LTR62_007187 [Meristemomyces frigidus]
MPIGEEVELRGPTGDIIYQGHGKFSIYGEEKKFKRVSLVLGGTGLTPGYSLIARVCLTPNDKTELKVIDANKGGGDIVLRLNREDSRKGAKGLKGHVTEDIIHDHLFPPIEDNMVLLCGPPTMIQKAVVPRLEKWGYSHDKNMFGL